MSFEHQKENATHTFKKTGPFFRRSLGYLDLYIIGFCILSDKLLNINLLVYCLGIYLAFRILFISPDHAFAVLISLVPNLAVMFIPIPGLSVPIINVLIGIALFKVLISNFKKPINKSYLFIIGLFIAYEWSHIFYYDIKSIILLFSWSFAILYVSLYFFYSLKSYNHKVVIIYSIAGVLISIFYGTLDFFENYGTLMSNNATIRFKGGAGDPNYFSMYVMISLFLLLYLVKRETNKFYKFLYPLLFVFLVAFGVLSLSRMFLLVISLLLVLLLIKIIFRLKKNKKILFFIMSVIGFLVLFSIFFISEFTSILNLLLSRFTDFIDDPSALTSNRNVLAEQYIELLMSDTKDMIFGMGIQDYHLRSGIQLQAHNIILELLVVWGLVGFLVFILFIATFLKFSNVSRFNVKNDFISWLPIICMGISYLSLNAMSNESFFLLLLFAIKNLQEFDSLEHDLMMNEYG
ncbi:MULTISPECIES: O-antigen ligase family protein [unclassified Viridibacillus]|uniref:O-antigen ligase family protein n=1 Tax=unclassified Viridibacillus TaxID=2617942 RepID=UPI0030F4FC5B